MDVDTWNAWVQYVGRYGGYGAELAQTGSVNSQTELDGKLSKHIYGCNVVAGRTAHDNMLISEGGNAGGYVGYMQTGVITNGQSYDMKQIRAMRSAGGYAGKMQTGAAAEFGSADILVLNLNIGQLVQAAQVFVPTVKSGTVRGWQSGMTVTATGSDFTNKCGYSGGFVGYNNEGKFTSNRTLFCDVVRGTKQKTGPFSGGTRLESVYSFNTLESIEKVDGEENRYSVYRNTDLTYALSNDNQQIGEQAVTDSVTNLKRFDVIHLSAPVTPGENEAYYKIYGKWNGAKLAENTSADKAVAAKVYVSSAKAVLMLDTPTYANDESMIPNPGEVKDPCGNLDLTIQKVWNDQSNKDKSRPGSIKVRIWQNWENENGTPVMDNGTEKKVLFTDSAVIPDVDTTDGWFTVSSAEHGRSGSATWTRTVKGLPVYTTVNDTTYYFSYTVEEAPVTGYTAEITYDESGATATATIVNTPGGFRDSV